MPNLSWNPNKKHSDPERWVCIYPAFINSKKTVAEGRRIAKNKCIDNPTSQEMRDVLQAVGLKIGVENKIYPRERSKEMLYRGRIRVQLKNDDDTLVDSKFPTRNSVMLHMCEMIPKLKTRTQKQSTAETSSNQSTGGAKKGKGKKSGRR